MGDFFAMGGYAAYVWPAFGFALVVLIGLFVLSWQAVKRREAELAQLRLTARGAGDGVARPTLRPAPAAQAPADAAARGLSGQAP